jgi:hypothetical protein
MEATNTLSTRYCDRCGKWTTTTPVRNHTGSSFTNLCARCAKPFSHEFDNGVRCYDTRPIVFANGEDCLHDDSPEMRPTVDPKHPVTSVCSFDDGGSYCYTHEVYIEAPALLSNS